MTIEQEIIQLRKFHLTPASAAGGGHILAVESGRRFKLDHLQFTYMQVLQTPQSLEQLVGFFMRQGWLVSFRELYNLMAFLVSENLVLNSSIQQAFKNDMPSPGPLTSQGIKNMQSSRQIDWKKLPFFRSLGTELAQYLLQKKEILSVPAHTRLIQSGAKDRELYILLKGKAYIYYVADTNKKQLMATLHEGSIFGERGFLLGQARTADIVTTEDCEVLKIHHLPEYDQYIKSDKAEALQHRFWVLQALASSSIFKNLPGDSLDQLMFSGKLLRARTGQTLFNEEAPGTSCYILIQGNVVVSRRGRNINVLKQGSCFGEISLLFSGTRTATITCQQDSILLEIQQADFYRVLSKNIFLAREIEMLAVKRLEADQKRAG